MSDKKTDHGNTAHHLPPGLTQQEAEALIAVHGFNRVEGVRRNALITSILHVVYEPMFLLLAIASTLYFFLGDLTEAVMMVVSILFVAGIEIFQETKSERALEALRKFTEARVRVLRDGVWIEIDSSHIVPGDIVAVSEGERIPADGWVVQQNDLSVDESVLTGESMPVEKSARPFSTGQTDQESGHFFSGPHRLFQGTTVAGGKGILEVGDTGNKTAFGKLGKSIETIEKTDTPLQIQINRFVRFMGYFGLAAFALVFALNMWITASFWQALLFSLTIAMALIPEEIPVAFTTFMGLGAYRMIRSGILAKQPKTVESLGSATVICLDKTGTITENRMAVAETLDFSGNNRTLEWAFWASEEEPFDAMEQALETKWQEENGRGNKSAVELRQGWNLIKEYALSGRPPMMTHVWRRKTGETIVASKGAVERILHICNLGGDRHREVMDAAERMAEKGYRVLGVASGELPGAGIPDDQDAFDWTFEGLVAFFDPPKRNVNKVFGEFYQAGIRVIMITGDHPATARNIARQTGLAGWELSMTGKEVMELDDASLADAVTRVNVFARMFPDAKLRVVEALKANGETVAMSGDGVNDGPALKSAQIGVAMGKKGTEIAKTAASLVLLSDNLRGMVTAVKMGRRIYDNLRKAIRYVISIHLPIVLLVLVPLLLQWPYPHILLPLHVIFLELVMDPVAAVAFENEPAERNLMRRPPRPGKSPLFTGPELGISLLQGAVIALVVLGMYRFALHLVDDERQVRSIVFTTMVSANLFLTLANRSFYYNFWQTIRYRNRLMPVILGISMAMLLIILYVPPVADAFKMAPLAWNELLWCLLAGWASILWFEAYKWFGRRKKERKTAAA